MKEEELKEKTMSYHKSQPSFKKY